MNEAHPCQSVRDDYQRPLLPISVSADSKMEPTGSELHWVLILVCPKTQGMWFLH